MSDEKASPAARIAAANALLDRGFGRPTSIVDTHIEDKRDIREWTTEELDAFLNEAIRAEAVPGPLTLNGEGLKVDHA
jgi:hypothetical protein